MFLLILKAGHNGKITDDFIDAIEAALRMAGDQVSLLNANVLHFFSLGEVALVSNYYLELDILGASVLVYFGDVD